MTDETYSPEYRGTLDIQEQIARIDKVLAERKLVEIQTEEYMREQRARIDKMMAERDKTILETKWYHIVIISGATLALVAIVKLFL